MFTFTDAIDQRHSMTKYVRSISNGFLYALEACLVNLELPQNWTIYLFGCLQLGELWSSALLFLGLFQFYIKLFEVSFPKYVLLKILFTLLMLLQKVIFMIINIFHRAKVWRECFYYVLTWS